jgi:predicted amidohydrolase YtcJ
LGFGSDWPVVGIDPWTSVFAAVHRQDPPGSNQRADESSSVEVESDREFESDKPWESEAERMTLSEALLGHTFHAAEISRLGHFVGKLAPGFKADFIVLDRSLFAAADLAAAAEDGTHTSAASSAGSSSSSGSSGGGGSNKGFLGGLPIVVQAYMDGVCVYGCEQISQV